MATARTSELDLRLVDYQVRAAGNTMSGEIEGVRPAGVRVHKIPGHPRHAGYLPGAAFVSVDGATKTAFRHPGPSIDRILYAPPPPEEARDGWRKSTEWWAGPARALRPVWIGVQDDRADAGRRPSLTRCYSGRVPSAGRRPQPTPDRTDSASVEQALAAPTLAEYQDAADLRAALRTFLRRGEKVARAHGLTPQRHMLLLMIKGSPDGSEQATVMDLVDRLALAQSAVTELIDRSEDAGLVVRASSESDRRVVLVRLTSEGERRLAGAVSSLHVEREALRGALSRGPKPQ